MGRVPFCLKMTTVKFEKVAPQLDTYVGRLPGDFL
jgi:hypothetical protein